MREAVTREVAMSARPQAIATSAPSARRPSRGLVIVMLAVAGIVTASAVARVFTQQRIVQLGYQISSLRDERSRVLEAHRKLKVEFEQLKSAPRVIAAAEKLGMRPPEPEQIRRVKVRGSAVEVALEPTQVSAVLPGEANR